MHAMLLPVYPVTLECTVYNILLVMFDANFCAIRLQFLKLSCIMYAYVYHLYALCNFTSINIDKTQYCSFYSELFNISFPDFLYF